MKEIFLILGILIEGSGFDEIVFQSGLSTSGSLNSIIYQDHITINTGKYTHFSEALEPLLFERFLIYKSYEVKDKITDREIYSAADGDIGPIASNPDLNDLHRLFEAYKGEVRAEKLGKQLNFRF